MRGAKLEICSFVAFLLVAACGGDSPSYVDAGNIDAPISIDAPPIDARLEIDRDRGDLGMMVIGETTPPRTFTLTNPGRDVTGALTVTVTGAGYRVQRDTCSNNPLAAAATCQVAVVATPSAAGPFTGTLKVTASPGGEVMASLTAVGLTPGMLRSMPAAHDFGMITAGTLSAPRMITIDNTGGAGTDVILVTLAGPDAASFEIVNNGCMGLALGAGESCLVSVRMRPDLMASGAKTAMVTASAVPGGNAVTTLTGMVQRPAVIAITGSGAFGGVLVGASVTRSLMVTNTGELPTGPVTITRTGAASFQVLTGMAGDCDSGVTVLMPAATCTVRVRFNPTAAVAVIGTITATGMPGGSAMASLTGTGQRPAQLAGDLTMSFGLVEVGVLSTNSIAWTITNTGNQPSSVPMLSISNPELVATANTCTAEIPAAGTCVVTLKFQPTAGGPRTSVATLAIAGSMVTAAMSATGAWRVTLTRAGDAGRVTSVPPGLDCNAPNPSCSGLFAPGAITLQARTTNGSLVYFAAWSGPAAGACADGPNRDCPLTVNAAKAITATFLALNYNLAFVSSSLHPTNLGGTAAYDAICNSLATAAGINDAGGAAYIAWMSDANASAVGRLGPAAGWVRMDGRVVALDRASLLTNQRVLNPVRYSETGEDLGEHTLMTGTLADGTTAANAHCNNWSAAGAPATMMTGNSMAGPTFWSATAPTGCSAATYRVMCMMKTIAAGPAAPSTFMGKKVWLSNAVYGPSPVGNPDTVCNTDRPAGVATGRALLARTTSTAASALTAGTMYVRPDGQEVGTGAEIVMGLARGGIWQSGNGTYWSGQAWTGSATIDAVGSIDSTCGNWIEPSTSGRYTLPSLARRFWGTTLPVTICSNLPATGPRLQCYEP